jgi:transposase
MNEPTMYVGLDLGVYELSACIVAYDGELIAEQTFEASCTNVIAFIENHCHGYSKIIGIEAGSTSAGVARKLRELGLSVHVFEARQASKFLAIRRNKTDANDARGIADLVRLGQNTVSKIFIKSVEFQHLRSKLILRETLIRQRMGAEGAIGALIRMNQGRLLRAYSAQDLRYKISKELDRIRLVEAIDLSHDVEPVLCIAESIRNYLKSIDREIKKQAASIDICSQFMKIPGVGPITALSFYSAVEDPYRFHTSADVGPYFGLAPAIKESGDRRRKGGISRMGNVLTRKHLVRAATVMMAQKPDCATYKWAKTLRDRIGPGKARTALARKLAVVMLAMWKSGQPFQPMGTHGSRSVVSIAPLLLNTIT